MLTQGPVSGLLEGAAASLDRIVAPELSDPFALMQVRALRELLLNLAPRVDWRSEEYRADGERLTALLALAEQAGWSAAGPAAAVEAAGAERDALVEQASNAQGWLGAQAPEGAAEAAQMEAEAAMLAQAREEVGAMKSTMYAAAAKQGEDR